MPLHRVDTVPRDEGFEIGFAMTDGTKQVRCYAQDGALDVIETGRTATVQERLDRFARHRHAFEAVASSLFDAGLPLRITSAHLNKLLAFSRRT